MMDRTDGAPSQLKLTLFLSTIYVNAFVLGAVIMGYEMLGSRYLSPYFGGDIYTWGALISTVLLSMMAGAYAGGHLADRYPSTTFSGIHGGGGRCLFLHFADLFRRPFHLFERRN